MEENNTPETGLTVDTPGVLTTVIGTNATKLAEMIMANVDKINEDPKFIPQAEAINGQIKSLIDLGKSEIEMLKLSAFLSAGHGK